MKKFYWLLVHDFLFNFSSGLIHVFLPLYLLQELDFPLWVALLPLLTAMLTYGTLSFPGYKIQKKIGTKKFFIIHFILAFVHSSFLILIPFYMWAFWAFLLLSPLTGLFSVWQPYQVYLAKYTDTKLRGRQMSLISVTILLASAFGAAAGSLILTYFGFVALVLIKYVAMLLRALPILKMDNFFAPAMKWRFGEVIRLSFSKRFRKTFLAQFVFGFLSTGKHLWPIFIFVSLKSYVGVGSVISIALLLQIFFILSVGGLTDKLGRSIVLKVGSFLNSFSWLGRFAIAFLPKSVILFLGLETYTRFIQVTANLPFQSSEYDKVAKKLDYRPLYDIMSHLGQVPAMFVVVVLLFFFPFLESYIFFYFLICAGLVFFLPLICNHEK